MGLGGEPLITLALFVYPYCGTQSGVERVGLGALDLVATSRDRQDIIVPMWPKVRDERSAMIPPTEFRPTNMDGLRLECTDGTRAGSRGRESNRSNDTQGVCEQRL